MKLCSPSNGCETRPVKGDPPTPVASLAASAVTKTPMRRHASEWAVGLTATKERSFWVPRAWCSLKALAVSTRWARRDAHPAGSEPTARWKRTAQAPGRPFFPPCRTRDRGGHRPGTTGAAADGRAGVGGLHTSEDGRGTGWPPDPAEQRRPVVVCAFEGTHDRRVDVGTHVTRHSKGSGSLAEGRCVVGTISSARASDSRANLGRIAMSHISGRAGWWKPPSPVLVRASGEQSPGATRQDPAGVRRFGLHFS